MYSTYALSNYWRKNPKQCVLNVCQNNFDVLWESICNSRGIAVTDFSSSWSLLDKQFIKPLVFTLHCCNDSKSKSQHCGGRRKGEIPAVLLLSSALPRGLAAVVPLFPCPQTPFDGLHIRDLLFYFIFLWSLIVLHEDWIMPKKQPI